MLLAVIAIGALALAVLAGPVNTIAQDEAAEPTVEAIEQPEVTPEEGAAERPIAGPGSGSEPVTEPGAETEPTAEPGAAAGEGATTAGTAGEDAPASSAPAMPSLAYAPGVPACEPGPGQPSEVPAGGNVDFDCALDVWVTGEWLEPEAVSIDWEVEATGNDGWQVRLLPPAEPGTAPTWTEPAGVTAAFRHMGPLANAGSVAPGAFVATERLAFGVRLHRGDCVAAADPVRLDIDARVTSATEGVDAALLEPEPDPVFLSPPLAPLETVEPSVAIVDVAIDPTTFSLTDQVTRGSVTIRVDNPVRQCESWTVSVRVQGFVGLEFEEDAVLTERGKLVDAPAPGYEAASGDGDSPWPADVVSVIHASAGAGSYTQTIGFVLTIPGQVSTGAYQAKVVVTVDPVR